MLWQFAWFYVILCNFMRLSVIMWESVECICGSSLGIIGFHVILWDVMQYSRIYGTVWSFTGLYRAYMGICGMSWDYMGCCGLYGTLWGLTGFQGLCGILWCFTWFYVSLFYFIYFGSFYGILWDPVGWTVGVYESAYDITLFYGIMWEFAWLFIEFHEILWIYRIHCIL